MNTFLPMTVFFPINGKKMSYGAEINIGIGEVTQHHKKGRAPLMNGPIIEVVCQTLGGMSGGPAFDKNGFLFGVLSWSGNYPDGGGTSQVSSLMHALIPQFSRAFPLKSSEKIRLLDIPHGYCAIDQRDRLSLVTDPETGAVRLLIES